ncbi:MAG TPA: hypothetical protein VGK29_18160 [Paludibaculum sp.]|jgi:hypothetical protein
MTFSMVALAYTAAFAAAIFLLWRFSNIKWYWHLLAVVAAIGLGLMPPLPVPITAVYDMIIGVVFLLLVVWGIGEPVFKVFHIHRHI